MEKIRVIPLVASLFIISCATYPPPRVENGLYINPKYEFSVKIPEGWTQTQEIPKWMGRQAATFAGPRSVIAFFNKETKAAIQLSCNHSSLSMKVMDYKNSFRKNTEERFDKLKKDSSKNPYIKNLTYRLYWFTDTGQPSRFGEISALYDTEVESKKMYAEGFIFGCHKDDTCVVSVVMVSEAETFDKNMRVFTQVVDSLRHYKSEPVTAK